MTAFTDRAGLSDSERAALEQATAVLATLEQVVRWGLALPEPADVLDVVIQDEYTHDVTLRWRSDRYVVFDAT